MDQENLETHKGTQPTVGGDGSSSNAQIRVPPDHRLPAAPEPKLLPATGQEPPEKPAPRWRKWLWWLIVLLVIGAIYFVYRSMSAASAQKSAAAAKGKTQIAAITIGQSKTGNMNIYVDAVGIVTPTNTVTVYSQVTGRVMEVHYKEGQMVFKGDPLIDIDPRPYQATLAQAEGTLAHDQGLLAEARIDLKRYIAADAQNAIAKQQLEDQEQTVIQYEGTVKADEGNVAYDQVQLDYCHIVSPITGRVGLRLVDPGNTIFSGSSSTLVVIAQLQPITVVFNVSEDDLPQVQAQLHGNHKLEVDAFDRADEKKIEAGTLGSFDNQIDTTTGTVKFRADFPNKNLVLFPNQFVNARLLVRTLRSVTLVPSAAVQHNGTNAFVYMVNPNKTVTVQQIKTLNSDELSTAVDGLNAGVNVATSGFDRLENGAQVLFRPQPKGNSQGHGSKSSPSGSTPQ
jgi:membrane fusion protein, multidrug efflux system